MFFIILGHIQIGFYLVLAIRRLPPAQFYTVNDEMMTSFYYKLQQ